jgi:putative ABC transport system ATP-binding protein
MVTGSAQATPTHRIVANPALRIPRITPYALASQEKDPAMTETILSLDNAALTLDGNAGRVEILRGITLDIARGETVGLIGPSGSGKSSLLMLMGGLERATGGKVDVLGHDLTAMDEDALARFRRNHMGVVFQSFHLIPTMTALENVATPLELAGAADAFERAEAELQAVGLGHRINHYPAQLSGGEQQRVALARAAAPQPDILLADEPTGNLDGTTGAQIMELLFGLNERHGSTLILVTHAPELAERCSRIIRLEDGRVHPESLSEAAE